MRQVYAERKIRLSLTQIFKIEQAATATAPSNIIWLGAGELGHTMTGK